jgi:hypothetical protein
MAEEELPLAGAGQGTLVLVVRGIPPCCISHEPHEPHYPPVFQKSLDSAHCWIMTLIYSYFVCGQWS